MLTGKRFYTSDTYYTQKPSSEPCRMINIGIGGWYDYTNEEVLELYNWCEGMYGYPYTPDYSRQHPACSSVHTGEFLESNFRWCDQIVIGTILLKKDEDLAQFALKFL